MLTKCRNGLPVKEIIDKIWFINSSHNDKNLTKSYKCFADIDDCIQNPCMFNGTCIDGINDFKCDCLMGFRGKKCAEGMIFFFKSIFPLWNFQFRVF